MAAPTHARIAVYQAQPGTTFAAARARVRSELVPLLQQQPGLQWYTGLRDGRGIAISVSAWESREQAEQAALSATGWMAELFGSALVSAQDYIGELVFHTAASDEVPGYARIAIVECKPERSAALCANVEAGLVPLLHQQAGFLRYVLWRTGAEGYIAYTAFATRPEGTAAAEAMVGWVNANIAGDLIAIERHACTATWWVRKD